MKARLQTVSVGTLKFQNRTGERNKKQLEETNILVNQCNVWIMMLYLEMHSDRTEGPGASIEQLA